MKLRVVNKSMVSFAFVALSGIGPSGIFIDPLYAWSAGPPAYATNAPRDSTCNTNPGCHDSFLTNSSTAKLLIAAPAVYTPGQSVNIKVSLINSSGKLHGFEMTAVDANGKKVGTFKKIGTFTQVIPVLDYRGLKATDRGKYIEHTKAGSKQTRWRFKWKSPVGASNPITFYVSGVDADGNAGSDGDYVYTALKGITAK
jgi:Reeler domain-containing protein